MRFIKNLFHKLFSKFFSSSPGQKITLGDKTYILIAKHEWFPPAYPDLKAVIVLAFEPADNKTRRAGAFHRIEPVYLIGLIRKSEII